MSKETIHVIVTVGIIALMFAWVPLVNIVCPPGWRSKKESSTEEKEQETRQERQSIPRVKPIQTSESSLSSPGLAERSRDLLQAMSIRGDREIFPSPTAPRASRSVVRNSLSRREINGTCAE